MARAGRKARADGRAVAKMLPAKKKPVAPKVTDAPEEKKEIIPFVAERLTEAKILEAFDLMGITSKLKDDRQKALFLEVARMNRLNPLKREIHAVSMWDADAGEAKLVPVTGYEVYIDRAEESGRLEWWHVTEAGEGKDLVVTVHIKRKDWPRVFDWTARYSECVKTKRDRTPNVFWRAMPVFMTRKVAIAQGFRLCLREVLRGMPYIADEVASEPEDDEHPPLQEPKAKSEPLPAAKEAADMKKAEADLSAAGAKLDAALAGGMAGERKAQDATIDTAKAEASRVYKECVASNKMLARPYGPDEVKAMADSAKAAADAGDVARLRSMVIDWTVDLDNRRKGE